MPTDIISDELFSKLKNLFPNIKLGNKDGMSTTDPKNAAFFDFDFVVSGEKIASVSISIAEEGFLKLFYTKDILKNQDEIVKEKWFKFLRNMREFSKKNLLSFEPKDITKQNLDKRDYEYLANSAGNKKHEDFKMSESSLYGSTKSSYQTLENTKLIIRHSKKIQEESPNSRTRNIQAIYVESADGERFKYPFIHLSGARAMQRHVANGGNPYDSFGQYIVSLSEQIYGLRKFTHLVSRTAFLENAEVVEIASAARQKTNEMKKSLERIQKQSGYESMKENFIAFEKKDIDADILENLKAKFTINQFNEELVDLFPYISDLVGEAKAFVKGKDDKTGDYSDKDAADEPIDIKSVRDDAYELMQAVEAASVIKMEPFDKASIQKSIEDHKNQIEQLKKAAAENPKDKKTQYALEKAEARMGLLSSRLASADPKANDNVTKNALMIEHLSAHVKDDKISLLLSRISDDYPSMDKNEQREVNNTIRKMMSKVKLVPMFTAETTFEELEGILSASENNNNNNDVSEKFDIVKEYESLLDTIINEKNDLLSKDLDVKEQAIKELNELMKEHFPAGTNGINAIESLRGIIDDPKLFEKFKEVSQEDADACVRPIIFDWIKENAPEIVEKIETGDMDAGKEKEDQMVSPDSEPKTENYNIQELAEFIRSFYDKETQSFPKGPEGVAIMVGKKFGEQAEILARKMVEKLAPEQANANIEDIARIKELAGLH